MAAGEHGYEHRGEQAEDDFTLFGGRLLKPTVDPEHPLHWQCGIGPNRERINPKQIDGQAVEYKLGHGGIWEGRLATPPEAKSPSFEELGGEYLERDRLGLPLRWRCAHDAQNKPIDPPAVAGQPITHVLLGGSRYEGHLTFPEDQLEQEVWRLG